MNIQFLKLIPYVSRLVSSLGLISLLIVSSVPQKTYAQEACSEKRLKDLQVAIINCRGDNPNSCEIGREGAPAGTDYAGRQILNSAQMTAIEQNASAYKTAASETNIPWQMLAVIHLRESGLKRENPPKGQGIYQFVNKQGGPYPTGAVSDAEFLRQTKFAAEFLKAKAKSNYAANRELTAESSAEVIKDTFFSYNGRSNLYARQAGTLGYDSSTQGYEGSPYVMNKADAQRDPKSNPTGWGQIKTDHGGIQYPANNDYGAFVVYAALAGVSLECGLESGAFVWPEKHSVAITSCFGPRVHPVHGDVRNHAGLDMAGGEGTPILAAAGGVVIFAGSVGGYGPNYVVIKHNNGYGTGYGHMNSKMVSVGDKVSQGQQIGTEGNKGVGTGSHLHFNVFKGEYTGSDRANVNPLQHGLSIPGNTANPKKCK